HEQSLLPEAVGVCDTRCVCLCVCAEYAQIRWCRNPSLFVCMYVCMYVCIVAQKEIALMKFQRFSRSRCHILSTVKKKNNKNNHKIKKNKIHVDFLFVRFRKGGSLSKHQPRNFLGAADEKKTLELVSR